MCSIFCILILFVALVSYFQINTVLLGVKDSVFSISQNAIIAYNQENLPYDVYDIDMEKLGHIMQDLLYKNHMDGKSKVQAIDIKELYLITNKEECIIHTDGGFEDTILHVKLEVSFVPIINMSEVKSLEIHEDVKLALMKY